MTAEITTTNSDIQGATRRFNWLAAVIDVLFPPRCVACGIQFEPQPIGPLFCPTCNAELQRSSPHRCPRCALICSEADLPRGDCGTCRDRKLRFQAARTVGTYEGAMRRAVLNAKHALHESLAAALGIRLAEVIGQQPFDEPPDLIVPVPLHWLKHFHRKMNPASVVAQAVAKQLGIPQRSALVCRRVLRRQATLSPRERKENVRGAFRASRWCRVKGQRILLVDDVMTTAATAQECSRVLLKAGAAAVYVATVARSLPEF